MVDQILTMPAVIIIFLLFIFGSIILLLRSKEQKGDLKSFSILIACRNEAENITDLINNLSQIDYPQELYEVIIVDDASGDESWKMLQDAAKDRDNYHVYRIEKKSEEYRGKKAALKLAAETAKFDYFLFTDADCRVPAAILRSYSDLLNEETSAIIGWYITRNSSAFQRMIDISSAVINAVTARLGIPFSASGGNWVLKKDTFWETGGYEKIRDKLAGDDKLLLLQVKKLGKKIDFNYRCPVETILPEAVNFHKLRRKYGKFSSSPFVIKASVILMMIFYAYLPWKTIVSGFEIGLIYLSGLYLLWLTVLLRFRLKFKFTDLIFLLIIPYILIYFTLSGSFGSWEWKGQKQRRD